MNATTLIERELAASIVAEPEAQTGEKVGLDPRVLRGVDLLDTEIPGWVRLIDPETFRLRNTQRCVLGQVYGDYSSGLAQIREKMSPSSHPEQDYGFIGESFGDYHDLERDWLTVIAERQRGIY